MTLLDFVLDGVGHAVWAFLAGIWDDANRAVLISVLVGICAYFARRIMDDLRMSQSLAQVLGSELAENRRILTRAEKRGRPATSMRIDGVYRGLLATGNIRYLRKHQEALYRLYSTTRADDPDLLSALEDAIGSIGGESRSPVRRGLAAVRRALRRLLRRRA